MIGDNCPPVMLDDMYLFTSVILFTLITSLIT